jgi:hypothetical protein
MFFEAATWVLRPPGKHMDVPSGRRQKNMLND